MPHSAFECPPEDVLQPVGRPLQPPEREDEFVVGGLLGRTDPCLFAHGRAAPLLVPTVTVPILP